MLIGWPSGDPNGHDTLKSHLKLNHVNLPSSAIEASIRSPAKFDLQPYYKTIGEWSSIPERVKFTALQVSFFIIKDMIRWKSHTQHLTIKSGEK